MFTKMLRNLVEKFRPNLLASTQGYSMVKFGHLDDAFLELFELQGSTLEGQSLQQRDKKRRKRKGTEKILKK